MKSAQLVFACALLIFVGAECAVLNVKRLLDSALARKIDASEIPGKKKFYLLDVQDALQGILPGPRNMSHFEEVFKNCPATLTLSFSQNDTDADIIDSELLKVEDQNCTLGRRLTFFPPQMLQNSDFLKNYKLGSVQEYLMNGSNGRQLPQGPMGEGPMGEGPMGEGPMEENFTDDWLLGYLPKGLVCGSQENSSLSELMLTLQVIPLNQETTPEIEEIEEQLPEELLKNLTGKTRMYNLAVLHGNIFDGGSPVCPYTDLEELAEIVALLQNMTYNDYGPHLRRRYPARPKRLVGAYHLIKGRKPASCPARVTFSGITHENGTDSHDSRSTINASQLWFNDMKCESDTLIEVFNLTTVFNGTKQYPDKEDAFKAMQEIIRREAAWHIKRDRLDKEHEKKVTDQEIKWFLKSLERGVAFVGHIPNGTKCGDFVFEKITPFLFINANPLETLEVDYREYLEHDEPMRYHNESMMYHNESMTYHNASGMYENDSKMPSPGSRVVSAKAIKQLNKLSRAGAAPRDFLRTLHEHLETLMPVQPTSRILSDAAAEKLKKLAKKGNVPKEFRRIIHSHVDNVTTLHLFLDRNEPCAFSNSSDYSRDLNKLESILSKVEGPRKNDSIERPDSPQESEKPDEPQPTEDVNIGGDGSNTCFPASSTVELKNGRIIRMDQLRVGDLVRVGPAAFESVILFTHSKATQRSSFLRLNTASNNTLTLTPSHYTLTPSNRMLAAKALRSGDHLILADGSTTKITSIRRLTLQGLYNPQTSSGNIIVDGVLTSTYTLAVAPQVAHGLLAPLRALDKICGATIPSLSSYFIHGSQFWTKVLPKGLLSYEL